MDLFRNRRTFAKILYLIFSNYADELTIISITFVSLDGPLLFAKR